MNKRFFICRRRSTLVDTEKKSVDSFNAGDKIKLQVYEIYEYL